MESMVAEPRGWDSNIPQDQAEMHVGAWIYLLFFPFSSIWVSSSWDGAVPTEGRFSS